jgi:hypothetical protein
MIFMACFLLGIDDLVFERRPQSWRCSAFLTPRDFLLTVFCLEANNEWNDDAFSLAALFILPYALKLRQGRPFVNALGGTLGNDRPLRHAIRTEFAKSGVSAVAGS